MRAERGVSCRLGRPLCCPPHDPQGPSPQWPQLNPPTHLRAPLFLLDPA
jgi:hypothetical protein